MNGIIMSKVPVTRHCFAKQSLTRKTVVTRDRCQGIETPLPPLLVVLIMSLVTCNTQILKKKKTNTFSG